MDPPAKPSPSQLKQVHDNYRARINQAIDYEDDPLSTYVEYVHWIIKTYGEQDKQSGLRALLEEVTSKFKGDLTYKTDLRYLKLWALYTRQVDRAKCLETYAFLLANNIGTTYAALYEDYAAMLERAGMITDAEAVYKKGIKQQVRPLERLKTRYREFRSRCKSLGANGSTDSDKAVKPPDTNQAKPAEPSARQSNAQARYAMMLAPPAPGRRPEKLQCNLLLLFTPEGVEYSAQEARAKSLGLLGKRWGPPPAYEMTRSASSSSSSVSLAEPVNFNDDGQKTTTRRFTVGMRRRSSIAGVEPTVTINTKQALEDVLGMYNSPEKTMISGSLPGSKHAPLKKIEPVTPIPFGASMIQMKAATPSFRPFVDEDNRKENATPSAPPKFKPYVDPDAAKTPLSTLKETPSSARQSENHCAGAGKRNVLQAVPEEGTPSPKPVSPTQVPFAPHRDVFTEDLGQPKQRTSPNHARAKSAHDVLAPTSGALPTTTTLVPFGGAGGLRTPFKVFSPPPENEGGIVAAVTPKDVKPKSAFVPFMDVKPTFTPFKDVPVDSRPQSRGEGPIRESDALGSMYVPPTEEDDTEAVTPIDDAEDEEPERTDEHDEQDYTDDYEEEDPAAHEEYEVPHTQTAEADAHDDFQEIPLGGRFGQFNVMTPITERTFEFTSTRSVFDGTPSDRGSWRGQHDDRDAAEAAERLAAELRSQDGDEDDDDDIERIEPMKLHPLRHDVHVDDLEERTGQLTLLDTLNVAGKFHPPNPCNPFDPPIMTTLLTLVRSDEHFHDLRDHEAKQLESMQKFAKKMRKTSGNTSHTGTLDMSACFKLVLPGRKLNVTEKLGEGGFGAVFKASEQSPSMADTDDEDDDDLMDDDEDTAWVAVKVVKPRNIWEYHVLRRLHAALPSQLQQSLVLPHALYAFRDESFLILDLCPQGTLLSVVNNAGPAGVSQQGACLDELLVMFFAIELLRLLGCMHKVGFIHGDLKIDNCLLRLENVPGGAAAWTSNYQPSGEGGWRCKGIKLIDFGRTIDTRLFPPEQQFIAEWETEDRDCPEVREGAPWTYQGDYYGLAGIVYCMLFGRYMQESAVESVSSPEGARRKIATPFKRYWQSAIWTKLFDMLLNPCLVRPRGALPIDEPLRGIQAEMETWLQSNCNRTSGTLKGLLKKVEMSVLQR